MIREGKPSRKIKKGNSPAEGRFYKVSVVILAMGLIVSLLTYIWNTQHATKDPQNNTVNQYVNNNTYNKVPGHPTISPSVPPITKTISSPVKKQFLQVQISNTDREYDNDLTTDVINILRSKGYQTDNAGAGLTPGHTDNLITGQLSISAPIRTEKPFDAVSLKYIVSLKLLFMDGLNQRCCGQQVYKDTVFTNRENDEAHLLSDARPRLRDKLEAANSFPFCLMK